MTELVPILWANALLVAALMLATWLVSLARRNASIVDVVWGPGFSAVALATSALAHGAPARRSLVAALAALWGLRLGGYLLWRNHGKPEDFRYQAMRRHWGARFPLVSLATVFALQGALMFAISLPLQVAQVSAEPAELGLLDGLGATLWLVGMAFEAGGDWQLARFRARCWIPDSGGTRATRTTSATAWSGGVSSRSPRRHLAVSTPS
jgi:steroid 5-alpha reductase family enzyme